MDYKTKKPMKEDPLQFLGYLLIESLKYRLVRWSIKSSLAVNVVVRAVELYYFWDIASFLKLVQFGPAYFGFVYGMVVASFMILYRERVEKCMSVNVEELWSINAAGPKMRTMICKRVARTYTYIAFCCISAIITGILMVSPNANDNEFYYILNLLYKRWGVNGLGYLVCTFCYKLICAPIAISMMYHPYVVIYGCENAMFQAMMLIEHIKKLTWDLENDDESALFNDDEYQRVMQKRLVFCAKWHIGFTSIIRSYNRKLIHPIFPAVSLMAFFVGLGFVMISYGLYINIYHASKIDAWLISLELIDFCLLFAGICWHGQAVENVADSITEEILNINHYTFNKINKTTLLIMMQNSMVPLRLNFSDRLAVNYQFGISMIKGIYSIISVIATVQI